MGRPDCGYPRMEDKEIKDKKIGDGNMEDEEMGDELKRWKTNRCFGDLEELLKRLCVSEPKAHRVCVDY